MPEFRITGNEVSFWLQVKPRASRERLTEGRQGELRLELHAPATEGLANEACLRFFARGLNLPKAGIEILSGQRARKKLVRVVGRPGEDIVAELRRLAGASKG